MERYQVVALIGGGANGRIYLCRDLHLDRFAAMKGAALRNRRQVDAIYREQEALGYLCHRRFPSLMDVFEDQEYRYLVMSWVPGRSMDSIGPRDGGSDSEEQVLLWGMDLCDLLEELHHGEVPMVHGDLKPSNLHLDDQGRIHLLDFGSASWQELQDGEYVWNRPTHSTGTVGFAAPEQFEGEQGESGITSDLYSAVAMLRYWMKGEPASLYLRWIFFRGLRKNLRLRYGSARSLHRALKTCLTLRRLCLKLEGLIQSERRQA